MQEKVNKWCGWVRWELSPTPSRIRPLLQTRLCLQEGLALPGRNVSLVASGLGSLPYPGSLANYLIPVPHLGTKRNHHPVTPKALDAKLCGVQLALRHDARGANGAVGIAVQLLMRAGG